MTEQDKDIFTFLNQPTDAVYAVCAETDPHVIDVADTRLKNAYEYPIGYPADKKDPKVRIRIRYQITNDTQANALFDNVVAMYTQHVIRKNPGVEREHPYLREYLERDPLGLIPHDDSDARIYSNARRLVQAAHATSLTAPTGTASATASSATASSAVPTSEPADKSSSRKKKSKKKKSGTDPSDEASKASAVEPAPVRVVLTGPDAEGSSGDEPALAATTTPQVRVLTAFAGILNKLQMDLYLYLMANTSRFMDSTCNSIIEQRMASHDRDNNLKGLDRLAKGKRYSWDNFKADTLELCCVLATGGFYFLPLYTTPRGKGQIVTKWCHVIQTIHNNLTKYDKNWAQMTEKDALKRLQAFLSPKEVEVIEDELKDKHKGLWAKLKKSIRRFFRTSRLHDAIKLITSIDTAKFPPGEYNPAKHSKRALRNTLAPLDSVEQHNSKDSPELKLLKEQLAKSEAKCAELLKQMKRKKATPFRQTTTDTTPEPEPQRPPLDLSKERPHMQKLMRPNKQGKSPCIECARMGMRLFHDVCDPVRRAANAAKHKRRKPAPTFPPQEKDRRHPVVSYPPRACRHCVREDVDPKYTTLHPPEKCFRKKGGECDQAKATTRQQRADVVKRLTAQMRADRQALKPAPKKGKSQTAKRGKQVTFDPKTTTMADKYPSLSEAEITDSWAQVVIPPDNMTEGPPTATLHAPVPQKQEPPAPSMTTILSPLKRKHTEVPSSKQDNKKTKKRKKRSKRKRRHRSSSDSDSSGRYRRRRRPRKQKHRRRRRDSSSSSSSSSSSDSQSRSPTRKARRFDEPAAQASHASAPPNGWTPARSNNGPWAPPLPEQPPPPEDPGTPPYDPRTPPRTGATGDCSPTTVGTDVKEYMESEVIQNSDGRTLLANRSQVDPKFDLLNDSEPSADELLEYEAEDITADSRTDAQLAVSNSQPFPVISNSCDSHSLDFTEGRGKIPTAPRQPEQSQGKCRGQKGQRPSPQKAKEPAGEEEEVTPSQGQEPDLDDVPLGLWLPACSQVAPKLSFTNEKFNPLEDTPKPRALLKSEIKGKRLLQCYMHYRDPNGVTRIGRVKLDTQSNGCYSLPGVSLPRKWRPWEPKMAQGISGQLIPLGDPTYFTIMRNGKPVKIDTNGATPGVLNDGCVALLGLDAIYNLGIDIRHAIKHDKHVPVRYLTNEDGHLANRTFEAFAEYQKRGYTTEMLFKCTHLSERVVQQYLDTHPDDYVKKPINIESVDIDPKLPREIREMILELIKRYEDVFASHTNTLPPELTGVEPHMFKMKEGYVHRMAPRPTFSPARAKLINDWLDWALEAGLVEEATNTSYASRLILAAKRKATTPKSQPPDGVRVAWAGVDINEGITKTVPTYTDAWQQLYKVANLKYKFSADGLKQYWSIPLCPEAREITAFWTPRGLFQFTRMVMGTKNAATVAQNAYTKAMHTMLRQRSFPNIANFADDFLGGANTGESLVTVFEDFLAMCRAAKITLNPTKVRVGYEREQFFGLSVENGRIEPAKRNVDPVINMTYPTNRSELRSVMGVFNQFAPFVRNYGKGKSAAAILNALASPKAQWAFTERHRNALDTLKKQVQEDIHLYAPDNNHPLILETDGSDDGWGAVLYQLIDNKKRIIKTVENGGMAQKATVPP